MTRILTALGTCLVLGLTSAARAQDTAAPPPHLSVVDGQVFLDRESGREAAETNTPLVVGDRLRAEAGRAEVLLGDGSALHLDERTTVDVNGDNVVRLLEGRLVVFAEGGAGSLQVDTAPGSVRIDGSGEVRIALLNDGQRSGLDVAVVRGIASIVTDGGETPVEAGQQVVLYEGDYPSAPMAFNSARADAFYLWSQALLDSRRGTTSASYLPAELNVYANSFDQGGSWSYLAPYGYVWYPTVAATWRPYYDGRWRFYGGGYGWNFIGRQRWGYPTHHYGRWGLNAGRWYWMPSRGWSSAWVHWAVAPGYVGWCPLGWNNRPVLGFWGRGGYSNGYNPGRAWTVVNAGSFSRGYIGGSGVDPRVFHGRSAPAFVVQPGQPRIAVPRGSIVAPNARIAGNTAVPRGPYARGFPYSGRSGAPSAAAAPPSGSIASSPSPRGRGFSAPGSTAVYRPGIVQPPAVRTPGVRTPPAYSSRTYRGYPSPDRGAVAPDPGRAAGSGRMMRTPGAPSPPVIYYRGTPMPPGGRSSPADAYGRAGVAVPRNLPGSFGSSRSVMPPPGMGRGAAPPPQYRGPSVPYGGFGTPGPRSMGPQMGAPMRQMGPPPSGSPPPARSAPHGSSSHAAPRSGSSHR